MPLVDEISDAQLFFQIVGGDIEQFHVLRYRGTEGLCQLYGFEIETVCTASDLDLEEAVGQSGVLTIGRADDKREFRGIVSRIERTGESNDQFHYRIELVPTVWLLTHRHDSRIFQ